SIATAGVGIAGAGLATEGPSLGTSTVLVVGGGAAVLAGSGAILSGIRNVAIGGFNMLDTFREADGDATHTDPATAEGGTPTAQPAAAPTSPVPNSPRRFRSSGQPHTAYITVERNGEIIYEETLHSGNMTEVEKALGFPNSTKATHTEARAV